MARICISTLDPSLGGGVPTMAEFVYKTAVKAGHDPYLAFNKLDLSKDIRPWDVPSRGLSVKPTKTEINGMEAQCVSRVLPEFEFLHYVLNGDAWKEIIGDSDVCFAVGGSNQCAHPFIRLSRQFGCWVATPLWDDRIDRVRNHSFPRYFRDQLSKPLLQRIEREIYSSADPIYALSEHTAEAIVTDCGADQSRVEVVPYPINTKKFAPESDGSDEAPVLNCGNKKIILFVARFSDPRKNTGMLVEALARVRTELPATKLLLVGDEPTKSLKMMVEKMGLENAVEFIDYVNRDNLPAYYRAADVFAIPSNQEGLAIVGLEALASGTPVVATKCGGPEDYVLEDETGVLVPRDDPDAMAGALIRLLSDNSRRKQMSKQARGVVIDCFAREKLEHRFIKAFERLAAMNKKSTDRSH